MRLFRKKTAPAQPRRIPTHIAIVMDGNGRWAKQRGLPRPAGHKAGAESFRTIANYAKSIGLQYLTVYAFSTENWKRPEDEVDAIMDLLEKYLRPGGETRISNFLLWQSAYAEYYFTDVLWPDFGPEELDKAIDAFNARDRRFGGVK